MLLHKYVQLHLADEVFWRCDSLHLQRVLNTFATEM